MELTDIIKTGMTYAPYIASGIVINQIAVPLMDVLGNIYMFEPRLSKIKGDINFNDYSNLPKSFNAFDYAVLANSISHWKLEVKGNKKNYSKQPGDCKSYPIQTFIAYQKLADINNRKDIKNKIKRKSADDKYLGHNFLEVKHNSEWIPFEAVSPIPLNPNQLLEYAEEEGSLNDFLSFKKRLYLDKESHTITSSSAPGKILNKPTLDSLFIKGGLLGELYRAAKTRLIYYPSLKKN